jgi:hypothetical protein
MRQTTTDRNDFDLRLRAVLRRVIDSIWVLVVPRGRDRLCVIQVWFRDHGKPPHRDYLILHLQARANQHGGVPGDCRVGSLAEALPLGPLDLRQQETAHQLETALAQADLEALALLTRSLDQ